MYCKKIFSVSFLLFCAGIGLAQNTEKDNVVRIESGLVQGFDHEGSLGFLGIPYAKVERFMPPMPVDKWDTVMVCKQRSLLCSGFMVVDLTLAPQSGTLA